MRSIKKIRKYEFCKDFGEFTVYVVLSIGKPNYVFLDVYKHEEFRGHLVEAEGTFLECARVFLKIVDELSKMKNFEELKKSNELTKSSLICLDLIH